MRLQNALRKLDLPELVTEPTMEKASSVQAVVTNLVSGDTCSVTVTGGDAVHAGIYTASAVSISDTTKYELKETKIQTYTILPKAVTVSWKDTTKTYDGKALTPKAEVTGLAAGDTCKVTAVEGTTRKDAGTYTVTAKGLDNSDYVLSGDVKTTCTILPKTAAFTWKGTAARTYNKKASNVQAAVSNLVAGRYLHSHCDRRKSQRCGNLYRRSNSPWKCQL